MKRIPPLACGPIMHRPAGMRGFTFVELLIITVVLVIIAALAVPMFANAHTTQLRGAAQMVTADLAFAQIESMTRSDDLRMVVFDIDANTYHIASESDPDTPIDNPVGNEPYRVIFGQGRASAYAGVRLAQLGLEAGDRLMFGVYGELDQLTAATITLACQDMAVTILVDPLLGEASVGQLHPLQP